MTFIRMLITAGTAAGLSHVDGLEQGFSVACVAYLLWSFTTDPLPSAIDRGLEAFKQRYQR